MIHYYQVPTGGKEQRCWVLEEGAGGGGGDDEEGGGVVD